MVSAKGAYSAVRQNMYKQVDEQGLLPKKDKEGMPTLFLAMVGIAGLLDPEKYPAL